MRVPLGWLKDYIELPETAADIAERLTFAGIEVEAIETIGGDFPGIVVGEVRAVAPHPNADRLVVCTVFDGANECAVVCGAPNVRAGGKYPFAPVGARLPNGTAIRRAKLRGVESLGMLCAEDELGISDDHSGLMDLPAEAAAGRPLSEILGPPETVFDLEITPNRPDCLCLLGVARELAAVFGRPLRRPAAVFEDPPTPSPEFPDIEVQDAVGCPRYTARVLRGLRVGPAPAWMQRRLALAGIRPINNLVDITNYVLLETGQPLHAFDLGRLRGRRVVVRRARAGEPIVTLDGVARALGPETLVIADAEGAVAIAGIMGGAGSEIGETTSDVLIESACFQPSLVRSASRRLGLISESSYRFARGTDIGGAEAASRRAAALMTEFAGGGRAGGFRDLFPNPPARRAIRCRVSRLAALTGAPAEMPRALAIFRGLELEAAPNGADEIAVNVPSFRGDLREEVDLVEEYARIAGLERIPTPAPRAEIVPDADDADARALSAARRQWVALGLVEILNYSLTAPALLRRFGLYDERTVIRLPNALSEEYSVLRPSLLPQAVETLGRNRFRQARDGAIFEIGRVFRRADDGHYAEETRTALALMGAAGRPRLDRRRAVPAEEMWRWLRGLVEHWLSSLGAEAFDFEESPHPVFEAGRSFALSVNGAPAGAAGIVRRDIAAEWRVYEPLAAAEISIGPALAGAFRVRPTRPPPVYPASARDVALIVDKSVRHADIMRSARRAAPPELETIELFDIYMGRGVPEGRKSMAYSLTYRSAQRTLTDDEVEAYHRRVIEALQKDLKAEIRDA